MARPRKTGLDYFPFDVDFFSDEKMVCIAGEFGIKGELVAVKLLCAVYRNGYFVLWNDATKFKLLRDMPGVSEQLLQQIVTRLVYWKFFDESLFLSAGVLTSRGIQRRYFDAVKRRQPISHDLPYLTINVSRNPVNVSENPVNVNINPQIKINESKEKITTPTISPPPDKARQDAVRGEDFLRKVIETTPQHTLDKRLDALGITLDRFLFIARKVLQEWDDFDIVHQSYPGAVRHLFNHVRKKIRSQPDLLTMTTPAQHADDKARRSARRQASDEAQRLYRESVQKTGLNGWQQYCVSRGLDINSSAKQVLLDEQSTIRTEKDNDDHTAVNQ